MATKKRGLGKGLGALISDTEIVEDILKGEDSEEIRYIDVNKIVRNENQPRSEFDSESLDELAQSIKEVGLIQPILLMKDGDIYRIIAGERRYRASKIAGLKKIPSIVRNSDVEIADKIALIENIQREDLNPVDEANSYKNLIDKYDLTQEEMGKVVGKSRSYIANTIRLLNLDDRVMELLKDGQLTVGHCKVLLSIKDGDEQYRRAIKIINQNESVKEVSKPKLKKSKSKKNVFIRQIEEDLMGVLGTKVILTDKGKKKKIEIEYYTDEDLDRILEIISN